jgi:cathepsin B
MVACADNGACDGGLQATYWDYTMKYGTSMDSCLTYKSSDGTVPKFCPGTCDNGVSLTQTNAFFASSYKQCKDVADVKKEIMTGGPVHGYMEVYEDFYNYQTGIYKHVTGALLGGHAIKIVGWGTDKTAGNFWIVANSWGDSWGERFVIFFSIPNTNFF